MSDKNFKVKSGLNIPITSANILTTDANGNISSISTLPITSGGTGQTTANNALNALLPTQTGKSAQVLTTDASNTSWAPLYYQGLQSGGVTQTPRTYLNFVGATVTDDSANNATNVTIGSVASGPIVLGLMGAY